MKVVMSINEYKSYKNGDITLLDLKRRDIEKKANKTMGWIFKHKAEISLVLSVIATEVLPIRV